MNTINLILLVAGTLFSASGLIVQIALGGNRNNWETKFQMLGAVLIFLGGAFVAASFLANTLP